MIDKPNDSNDLVDKGSEKTASQEKPSGAVSGNVLSSEQSNPNGKSNSASITIKRKPAPTAQEPVAPIETKVEPPVQEPVIKEQPQRTKEDKLAAPIETKVESPVQEQTVVEDAAKKEVDATTGTKSPSSESVTEELPDFAWDLNPTTFIDEEQLYVDLQRSILRMQTSSSQLVSKDISTEPMQEAISVFTKLIEVIRQEPAPQEQESEEAELL